MQIQRAKQDAAEPAPTTNTTQGLAYRAEDRRQKLKRAQLTTKHTGSALDAASSSVTQIKRGLSSKTKSPATPIGTMSRDFTIVRPEGIEPPTYWV